jgi:cytochrome c oxidase assembly factor CtaG
MPFHASHTIPLARGDSFLDFITAWDFLSPVTVVTFAAVAAYAVGLYRLQRRGRGQAVPGRNIVFAITGLALAVIALNGPLDIYAERAFFVHMTQHLVLAMFAAPLLLAASPVSVYLWALPEPGRLGLGASLASQGALRRIGSFMVRPPVALLAFLLTFYIWHLPAAYVAALENGAIHFVEHLTMFASGVLFWWPIIGPAPLRSQLSYPQRLLYLLLVVTPKALLAAIITLSNHVLYGFYLNKPDLWGVSDAEDQVIAGLLMWVPGNFVFLAALTVLFFKWYEKEEGPLPGSGKRGTGPE